MLVNKMHRGMLPPIIYWLMTFIEISCRFFSFVRITAARSSEFIFVLKQQLVTRLQVADKPDVASKILEIFPRQQWRTTVAAWQEGATIISPPDHLFAPMTWPGTIPHVYTRGTGRGDHYHTQLTIPEPRWHDPVPFPTFTNMVQLLWTDVLTGINWRRAGTTVRQDHGLVPVYSWYVTHTHTHTHILAS